MPGEPYHHPIDGSRKFTRPRRPLHPAPDGRSVPSFRPMSADGLLDGNAEGGGAVEDRQCGPEVRRSDGRGLGRRASGPGASCSSSSSRRDPSGGSRTTSAESVRCEALHCAQIVVSTPGARAVLLPRLGVPAGWDDRLRALQLDGVAAGAIVIGRGNGGSGRQPDLRSAVADLARRQATARRPHRPIGPPPLGDFRPDQAVMSCRAHSSRRVLSPSSAPVAPASPRSAPRSAPRPCAGCRRPPTGSGRSRWSSPGGCG